MWVGHVMDKHCIGAGEVHYVQAAMGKSWHGI
jgi:hypothetical protein